MPDGFNINYVSHHQIDKAKWDRCMDEAANSRIYGYSFYLDIMSKHWDALVLDDYDCIMPLTWKKKFNIYYLYQPPFTANLGVFGKNLSEQISQAFVRAIHGKFRLIEISLNQGNIIAAPPAFFIERTNYALSLRKSYQEIYRGYRENHRRNIDKASGAGCCVRKDIDIGEIIELSKSQMKNFISISNEDYSRFGQLFSFLFSRNQAITYGIVDPENKLLASCAFLFSKARAYYVLVGNHPDSRSTGASHALIDAFIKDNSGKNLTLDFEGSDIESLALFYSGFGAAKEIYPAIRWNRLPWYIKWMKSPGI